MYYNGREIYKGQMKDKKKEGYGEMLYKENISEEIKKIEINLCYKQKNILNSIDLLKKENKILRNKIEEEESNK